MPPHLLISQTDKPSMSPAQRTPPPSSSEKLTPNMSESTSSLSSAPIKKDIEDSGLPASEKKID